MLKYTRYEYLTLFNIICNIYLTKVQKTSIICQNRNCFWSVFNFIYPTKSQKNSKKNFRRGQVMYIMSAWVGGHGIVFDIVLNFISYYLYNRANILLFSMLCFFLVVLLNCNLVIVIVCFTLSNYLIIFFIKKYCKIKSPKLS